MQDENDARSVSERAQFLVRDAVGEGVSRYRLRQKDLAAPFWGVRTAHEHSELLELCRALALRLPAASWYSHTTAARLFGIPLPRRLEHEPRLHVSVATGRRAVDAIDVIGHQVQLREHELTEISGVHVTTPARTWSDLAQLVALDELVAAGDHLLRRDKPLVTMGELAEVARRHPGRRGRVNRRCALPLLTDRSESPGESKLRMLLHTAGFTRLLVNEEVFARNGAFLARLDLVVADTKVALEYEGDHHRTDRAQWMRDIRRIESLRAEGWDVIRVTAADLSQPRHLLVRLRRALQYPSAP